MRYDRDLDYDRDWYHGALEDDDYGAEFGEAYEAPSDYAHEHGFGMGYRGGALRSRGSYQAGQLRSGLNARDEFEFEWGDGYVGGRGYGGTNYDYAHGYRVNMLAARRAQPAVPGYERYGPARYGYGPYHERLGRRRRSDEELRSDVEEVLFYDTWVDADGLTVTVQDGVVTLRGVLPSYEEVRYAADDVWDVDGVRGVRTEIEVGRRQEERVVRGSAEVHSVVEHKRSF